MAKEVVRFVDIVKALNVQYKALWTIQSRYYLFDYVQSKTKRYNLSEALRRYQKFEVFRNEGYRLNKAVEKAKG